MSKRLATVSRRFREATPAAGLLRGLIDVVDPENIVFSSICFTLKLVEITGLTQLDFMPPHNQRISREPAGVIES